MEIFSGRYFSFSSFMFVQTLIKWSYFVDDPQHFLSQKIAASQSNQIFPYVRHDVSTAYFMSMKYFTIPSSHKNCLIQFHKCTTQLYFVVARTLIFTTKMTPLIESNIFSPLHRTHSTAARHLFLSAWSMPEKLKISLPAGGALRTSPAWRCTGHHLEREGMFPPPLSLWVTEKKRY